MPFKSLKKDKPGRWSSKMQKGNAKSGIEGKAAMMANKRTPKGAATGRSGTAKTKPVKGRVAGSAKKKLEKMNVGF